MAMVHVGRGLSVGGASALGVASSVGPAPWGSLTPQNGPPMGQPPDAPKPSPHTTPQLHPAVGQAPCYGASAVGPSWGATPGGPHVGLPPALWGRRPSRCHLCHGAAVARLHGTAGELAVVTRTRSGWYDNCRPLMGCASPPGAHGLPTAPRGSRQSRRRARGHPAPRGLPRDVGSRARTLLTGRPWGGDRGHPMS